MGNEDAPGIVPLPTPLVQSFLAVVGEAEQATAVSFRRPLQYLLFPEVSLRVKHGTDLRTGGGSRPWAILAGVGDFILVDQQHG